MNWSQSKPKPIFLLLYRYTMKDSTLLMKHKVFRISISRLSCLCSPISTFTIAKNCLAALCNQKADDILTIAITIFEFVVLVRPKGLLEGYIYVCYLCICRRFFLYRKMPSDGNIILA